MKPTLVVLCISILYLAACDGKVPSTDETAKSGTLTVYVDSQIVDVVSPSIAIFEREHPGAKVSIKAVSASEAVLALIERTSRLSFIARTYTPYEDTLLADAKLSFPVSHIATDALVVFANRAMLTDTLSDDDLRAWLLGSRTSVIDGQVGKSVTSLVVPPATSSVFENVFMQLLSGKQPHPGRLTTLPSVKDIVNTVRKNKNVLGVGYLSQLHSDSTVKLIRIGFTNTKGSRVYPQHVHAGYVVQGMYPYKVPIHTILRDKIAHYSLPAGVAGYVYQNAAAQATFRDAGILPEFVKLILDPSSN